MAEHWVCPDCGPHVGVDEEDRCTTCGASCEIAPCVCGTKRVATLAAARARIATLEAALREARDDMDPDKRPPRLSTWERIQRIDAALKGGHGG